MMSIESRSHGAACMWKVCSPGLNACGQGQGQAAVADLGGSIITGIDGNPLAVLAAQLNIPLHAIDTAGVPLYLEDGRIPHPTVDKKVAAACDGHL